MKTRCIIVDDEPLAIEVLKKHVGRIEQLELVAECTDAVEAFNLLRNENVDLIFLDIQMPELSGIEFVRSLKNPPRIIFSTAYREYAFEGFELDVVDYLLKPIPFERFLKAVDKYFEANAERSEIKGAADITTAEAQYIYLKADKKMQKVFLDNIIYLESMRDYVTIQTGNKKIITKQTLNHFDSILPGNKFLRIHKSYIVSLSKIDSFTASSIQIGKREFTIGRTYKSKVFNVLRFDDSQV